MRDYVNRILVPYFDRERTRLQLPATQWCIAILDCWTLHKMTWFVALLKEKRIAPIFVPGGTTGDNQPQDLSVNRPFKAMARQHFEAWLASLSDADLARAGSLPALKANVLSWINAGVEHVRVHSDKMVLAGWRRAGILPRCFEKDFQDRAKFVVLDAAGASAVPEPGVYIRDDSVARLRALDVPASELVFEEDVVESGVVVAAAAAAVPPVPAALPGLPAVAAGDNEDEEGVRDGAAFLAVHSCFLLSFVFFFFFVAPQRTLMLLEWMRTTHSLVRAASISLTATTAWTRTTTTTTTTTEPA
jgi:hypothetical protein